MTQPGSETEETEALEQERARFRAAMGRYGVWRRGQDVTPDFAAEVERLGFGSLWVGGSPAADLAATESFLAATERLVVATGIVNIWSADAHEVAASWHRIEAAHPGRFILGIGAGHPESTAQADKPYGALVAYLDALEADGVPAGRLALAALGDRVLALAGARTLGAHPYFVPPEHTARARGVLGAGPLLVPEQRVGLEADPARARELLRPGMLNYFKLRNYRANLLRIGMDAAEVDAASDAAVDHVAVWGDDAQVRAGIDAHLEAGADHVALQVIDTGERGVTSQLPRLATLLGLV